MRKLMVPNDNANASKNRQLLGVNLKFEAEKVFG